MNTRTIFTASLIILPFLASVSSADGGKADATARMSAAYKARAEIMRAQAEIMKAQAEVYKAHAAARQAFYEAALTRQKVRSLAMDNQIKFASTHYAKKQIRAAYYASRKNRRRANPAMSPTAGDTNQAIAAVAR